MKYFYAAEKFAAARRALMLPHPRGIAESIASAFLECNLGLHDLPLDKVDDTARSWIQKLEKFMDTTKVDDPSRRGAWLVKAEGFSVDDQIEVSRLVDELTDWFERQE